MSTRSALDRDEQSRIVDVVARLQQRFPSIDPDRVERVVRESHHELDGVHVRDFVPILVEKQSRDTLERSVNTVGV